MAAPSHNTFDPKHCSVPSKYRLLSTSSIRLLQKVTVQKTEKETVVRGDPLESDRAPYLLKLDSHSKACPLCRLNLKGLKYTDVLILGQFIDCDGRVLSLKDSKLCHTKYIAVTKLIKEAQRCRLLPRPPDYPIHPGWDNYNTYIEFPKRYRDQPMHIIQKHYWR